MEAEGTRQALMEKTGKLRMKITSEHCKGK